MNYKRYELDPSSEFWPKQINTLSRVPNTLYVLGDPSVLQTQCISIIGARRATSYGIAIAEMAGRVSAECGITVVSGAAMGCDYAATRGALNAGGQSIIIPGTGADLRYPNSSFDIYEDTLKTGGAIVSIFPWEFPCNRSTFVQRNALIAALSSALLVTEAGTRSGTMSTSQTAVELGKTILAIPGSIFSPTSAGTNQLIAEGAHIIYDEKALEIAISMQYGVLRFVNEQTPREFGDILSALIASPSRPQELAERLNRDVLLVLKTITDFEMQGYIYRLPDGRFAPTKDFLMNKDRIEMTRT